MPTLPHIHVLIIGVGSCLVQELTTIPPGIESTETGIELICLSTGRVSGVSMVNAKKIHLELPSEFHHL